MAGMFSLDGSYSWSSDFLDIGVRRTRRLSLPENLTAADDLPGCYLVQKLVLRE